MGKRKRGSDNKKYPIPSESTAQVALLDLQPEQRSSMEIPASNQEPVNQSHFPNKLKMLRNSRNPLGRHYSRRGSSNHLDASPSYWKVSAVADSKLTFKLENKGDFTYGGSRERAYQKPERIRSSSFSQNAVVSGGDTQKLECRICQKQLKKSVFISGSSLSAHDVSVVAVLVCGHSYHADCLDQKTSPEDRQDPPCPLCLGHIS